MVNASIGAREGEIPPPPEPFQRVGLPSSEQGEIAFLQLDRSLLGRPEKEGLEFLEVRRGNFSSLGAFCVNLLLPRCL